MDLLVCEELVNDVSVVFLHDDHRLDLLSVAIIEFVSALLDDLDIGLNLLLVQVSELLERIVVALDSLG